MSTAAPFPGWERLEPVLLEALVAGDDVKLTPDDVRTVVGEVARLKGLLQEAPRVLKRVAAGDGCWASDQGYAACEHPGVERFLDGAPKRRRRRWWRKH